RSIRRSFYPKKLPHLERDHSICRAIRAGQLLAPSSLTQSMQCEEDAMQLVADRFVVRDGEDRRACDLASGSDVVLAVGNAGGVSDQLRWTDRCSALRALQHHAIAPLVDFGLLGEA